ncbi:AbiV family abortive infection protein (plasmid) [Streptomyces europaeiscabiei]|uniref:AbiV family abortive infection protein n=1 Tax=Streptomyces europaeiscabiei TaxID=146819 RepID=UPI002E801FB5|nr:AbiV family abortive infection protein [Streptomyces europaeiscabiei]WUD38864.1 AbiV family abortive infection protein [Streptomyces europaeiscabiei]
MAKLPTDPDVMARTVVDIAAASFTNARALLTGAQAVLDTRQWPTAFSVAALALEEVGKAAMCMTMLAMPPTMREQFRPQFEKAFVDHRTKAGFAHLILGVVAEAMPASLDQLMADAIESARKSNAVKFRGLYVDYTDTGVLLTPASVGEKEARWMVATVTTALAESVDTEAAVADPDVLLDFLSEWQDGVDFHALEAYVESATEEFIGHIRAFVRDDVPPPADFLGPALARKLAAADGAPDSGPLPDPA